ncbi:MAG: hypothetical protein EBR82_50895 [Caulobacteraceae bacterium]|nr:hypothetical protein [Caulobacteraceae bacterium]
MSDFPTVDRVIADLKRLAGGPWNTDREREIGNVMVDARHCLEQLSEIDGPGLLVENADLRAAIKHLGHNPVVFIHRAQRRRERASASENGATPG